MFDDEQIDETEDWLSMFAEGDNVVIDKGYLSERRGCISDYKGDGYFLVRVENDEEGEFHVYRLTKK
jgi:hypothetical protein